MTVFALHHAGGNSAVFDRVAEKVGASTRIHSLDLPGRGALRREHALTIVADAVDSLATRAADLLDDEPFIAVGHSMGAYLAQHLIHRLERDTGARCTVLIASSNAAPSAAVPLTSPPAAAISASDDAVIEIAERFSSLPAAVSGNAFLRHAAIEVMRHDFTLCDNLIRHDRPTLRCPVDVVTGTDDVYPVTAFDDWKAETAGACRIFTVPGGHFHPIDHPEGLAHRIQWWHDSTLEADTDVQMGSAR
jgi:pyochelin biosynthetic protein PchC